MSRRVRRVEYEHVDDEPGDIRVHDFEEGVEMVGEADGTVTLLHRNDEAGVWNDFEGAPFLVNPAEARTGDTAKTRSRAGARTMAKKKTPPRDPKTGRFLTKRQQAARRGAKKRRNPTASASSSKSKPRRRSNPPRRRAGANLLDMIGQGVRDSLGVIGGKVVVRIIPTYFNLPKDGATGLAIQALVAVGAGWATDRFLGEEAARMVVAGGFASPMEDLIKRFNVPVVASALSRYDDWGYNLHRGVGAYVPQVSGYVPANQIAGYVPAGGGAQASYGNDYEYYEM